MAGNHVLAYRLGTLAGYLGAELLGDADISIEGITTLEAAGPRDITFLSKRSYRPYIKNTQAGAVILAPAFVDDCPVAALVLDDPYLGYARAARLLSPPIDTTPGIAPSAVIDPDAEVASSASIGAHCAIEAGVHIGARTSIGPGSYIGRNSSIGSDGRIAARVVICAGVHIGDRVIIHPGAVIGGDGFGIVDDHGIWLKIPQLGGVRIGDDVEIGANTTIDRGALIDTTIEDGVKFDNLVHVGHNVRIGAHTAIAACVAIGGSAHIGRHCQIGGAVSIAGHLKIADDVHLTGGSGVPNSIPKAGTYSSGMAIQEHQTWRRNVVRLRHLNDMAQRLRALERKINDQT